MAEGARLESVYTRKCIEGSNPSLTAKFKEKAWIRVQAFFLHGAPPRGVRSLDRVRQNARVLDRQRRPAANASRLTLPRFPFFSVLLEPSL